MGKIPDSWETKKIKFVLSQRNENNVPIKSTEILSLTAKQGVIPYSEKEGGGNKPKQDFSAYKLTYPGDIVMNSMNILSGAVGLSKYMGCISPVYYALKPKNNTDDVRFFYYVFANKIFQSSLLGLGNGILIKQSDNGNFNTIRMRIPIEKINNLSVPYPSPSIQQQIADFLDHKTAEIGGLIDKIHTEIDTLKQYQSSVITQAVTKGLDPNVQMKDSGIEWIGEIPETWKTIKIKYLVDKLERGTAPKYTELHETQVVNQATFSKGFFDKSNMRYSTIPASQSRGLLQYQDVLVASTGGGVLGKVHYFTEHEEFVADSHVTIVRFIAQKLIPKFGYYYLSTLYDVFNNVMAQGSTNQIELKRDTFANSFIPFPRIEEQRVIVDYLDQKVTQIQKLINSKQQQINQLTEYKNSLIFEYVTGKKQVKEAN